MLQSIVLHCVAVRGEETFRLRVSLWTVLQRVAVCCSVLQCVAVCCSVLQCVAVCCSVLQCVAVCEKETARLLMEFSYEPCCSSVAESSSTLQNVAVYAEETSRPSLEFL